MELKKTLDIGGRGVYTKQRGKEVDKIIETKACCYSFWVHSETESPMIHFKPKTEQWIIPTRTCSDDNSGLIVNYCPFCGEELGKV